MRLFNHEIEVRLRARWPWTHMKMHRRPYYRHFVWGKLSVIFGQPHLEPITVCAECGEATETKSAGDEFWTWCEGCQTVEGRTEEITMEEYEQRQG